MLKAWSTQQLAERWLHEFYTRLSDNPSSLHSLYLDNAEAIYTGHVLSGSSSDEGYLMSGRSEIAGFFGCPAISAKFCGSKVKVDVVHPLPNPMCLTAISLSVKGTLFLPVNTGLYESAEYTHFLTLSPAAQRFSNGPVSYLVATEFLHIYRKPLQPVLPEQVSPLPSSITAAPGSTHQAPQEPPLLSHPPHMLSLAGDHSGRHSGQPSEPPPPPPPMVRRYNDELSLHAAEVTTNGTNETKGMTPQQLVEAVNEALKRIGATEGRCVHVMRPNVSMHGPSPATRTFFFLHFNKIELVEKLRKAGQLEICEGVVIKLSPIKRKYSGTVRTTNRAMSTKQAALAADPATAAPAGVSAETAATSSLENANGGKAGNSGGDSGRRKSLKFKRSTKI